jgi:hypothetical protein
MVANLMKKISASLFMMVCFAPFAAWSQVMNDPTRPPAGIGDSLQSSGMLSTPQVKGLQSVIISPEHCAAIIDGKTVLLGAKHGNEKLVEVTERGVVLQGEHGQRTMALFPTVGMTITHAAKGKQAVKCNAGQGKQEESLAIPAGQEEKK